MHSKKKSECLTKPKTLTGTCSVIVKRGPIVEIATMSDSYDVKVKCDRCGKSVEGMHMPGPYGMTAGYYDTTGLPWSKYANPGETKLCDNCMWADPRYQVDYAPPPSAHEVSRHE